MGCVERLVIAALLAFAVVAGAQTGDPVATGIAGERAEAAARAR